MGWNMIIFGFGFLVGGLTAWLILGLFFLANRRSPISQEQEIISAPLRGVANPKFSPQLIVLSGGKDRPSFNEQDRKAFS
jgi:hypothetical protein